MCSVKLNERSEKPYFQTLKIVGNLKTAFKEMLETNDWLQEADKKVAAEKVREKFTDNFMGENDRCMRLVSIMVFSFLFFSFK